ncbi:HAMP domain-containing histidine kinase [Planctomonas sp. JC2975]|uniref:sensor histidine kinase n=1 Tax=Planctomonas sp. JC2975 TaxID=2729626 RepID=UPI001473F579|nr:HAMP domain-containing sensor histidine kinase [Planctomonas sp. JC2975]NNC11150.1 HAMP domain-containing histidine kinase [Planctomonas sp. JC2975]
MRARRARDHGADAAAIARASRAVTAQITIAAAAIVVLVVVLSVAFIFDQSQPSELLEKPAPGETKIYVDADDMLIALIVVGIIAIFLAGLLSWVIARRAVRPLGEALRMQRTFVADASHELRTPVAVVAARVELLRQELDAGDDPTQNLTELRQDVSLLSDVITDLLIAATPPADAEKRTPTDVVAIAESTIADLQVIATGRNVAVRLDAAPGITTPVPPTTLRRCIVALVDNAVGHSPAGGTVRVAVAPARDRASFAVSVRDEGSGIIGIDSRRLFDRFARGADATSGGERSGFGIGLALVRDIADRYDGRIEVTDTSSAGTTFTLTLPRL